MNCSIWKLLRQNLQPIVWQSMTESAGRISVQPEAEVILHIIQTVPIFRWNIQQIFLMHWIFRMNYRHCILPVLYSMLLSERSFLTGRLQLRWFVRLLRIISFRITQFLLHIQYVRSMVISAESILPVRSAVRRRRFIAVLPVTTVRSRTGMTVRHRSIRTVPCMM